MRISITRRTNKITRDVLLLKWSTSGDLIWDKTLDYSALEWARCINFDNDGNLYVLGEREDWDYDTFLGWVVDI